MEEMEVTEGMMVPEFMPPADWRQAIELKPMEDMLQHMEERVNSKKYLFPTKTGDSAQTADQITNYV
jgi:hypothetical protein